MSATRWAQPLAILGRHVRPGRNGVGVVGDRSLAASPNDRDRLVVRDAEEPRAQRDRPILPRQRPHRPRSSCSGAHRSSGRRRRRRGSPGSSDRAPGDGARRSPRTRARRRPAASRDRRASGMSFAGTLHSCETFDPLIQLEPTHDEIRRRLLNDEGPAQRPALRGGCAGLRVASAAVGPVAGAVPLLQRDGHDRLGRVGVVDADRRRRTFGEVFQVDFMNWKAPR